MQNPRRISDLLNVGPRLQHLAQRARAAAALREQVQQALPAPLAAHVTGASFRRTELILAVDSPAFCARLRFEAPRVRDALARQAGVTVDKVSVRVQPPAAMPRPR